MLSLYQVHKITGLMGFLDINIQLTYGLSLMTLPRTIPYPCWASSPLADHVLSHVLLDFSLSVLILWSVVSVAYNIFHHPTGSRAIYRTSPGKTSTLVKPEQLTLPVENHTALLTAFISVSWPQISAGHLAPPSKPILFTQQISSPNLWDV